jgi:hypothetical protein
MSLPRTNVHLLEGRKPKADPMAKRNPVIPGPTHLSRTVRYVTTCGPNWHGDKWRIRWLDERGERQSAVHDDYKVAQTALRRYQVEVEEVRRGIRNAPPPEKDRR